MKWIKCSERTPNLKIDVLVIDTSGDIYMGWFDHSSSDTGDWYSMITGYILNDITHWMVLPDPPEEYQPKEP